MSAGLADQAAAFFGAILRRRSRAAAARPNRTIIGGAGTSMPLVEVVLLFVLVLSQLS